jgi:site-specific DNA recombinase
MQSCTKEGTAPKKYLFTNVLYCENCQKGMWYKANQKGYSYGGNIQYGQSFCLNRIAIREKELMHVILEDLQTLFNTLKEDSFMNTLLNKFNKRKLQVVKDLETTQAEIEALKNKKLSNTSTSLPRI